MLVSKKDYMTMQKIVNLVRKAARKYTKHNYGTPFCEVKSEADSEYVDLAYDVLWGFGQELKKITMLGMGILAGTNIDNTKKEKEEA